MKNAVTYLVLLGLLAPGFGLAADTQPPTSTSIYETLDDLWKQGRFDDLDSYVSELRSSWGDYLPARLAHATYSFKCQVDVEKALLILEELRAVLDRDLVFASPIFMDLLDSRILRYRKTAQFRSDNGYTREKLLTTIDPRKMDPTKRSKDWGDEMLYFNAPEVFLTEDGVIPAQPEDATIHDAAVMQKDDQELLQFLGDDNATLHTRKSAVRKLVQKRVERGDLKQLARGLDEANMVYTYRDTVEELTSVGGDAVPVILEALNDPASSNTDKKGAIWALVRIGVVDPEVIQSLRSIAEGSDRAGVAGYAERALKHLQRR